MIQLNQVPKVSHWGSFFWQSMKHWRTRNEVKKLHHDMLHIACSLCPQLRLHLLIGLDLCQEVNQFRHSSCLKWTWGFNLLIIHNINSTIKIMLLFVLDLKCISQNMHKIWVIMYIWDMVSKSWRYKICCFHFPTINVCDCSTKSFKLVQQMCILWHSPGFGFLFPPT